VQHSGTAHTENKTTVIAPDYSVPILLITNNVYETNDENMENGNFQFDDLQILFCAQYRAVDPHSKLSSDFITVSVKFS